MRGKEIHVGWVIHPIKIFIIFMMLIPLQAKERIVALSPVINELVFALDRGEWVVANTKYSTYPPKSKDLPKVGGFFDVSFEAILKAKPTLVIMQQNNIKLQKRLQSFGIGSLVIKVDRLESIKQAILSIGEVVDASAKAKQIVAQIETKLQDIAHITKDKKILMVIGESTKLHKGVFIVGHDLYLNDIIKISGNRNAFASKFIKQPILNNENIIATHADIVIILAPYLKDSKEAIIQAWQAVPIPASQKGNLFVMDKEYISIPSDRIVLFLEDFKKILKRVH